MPSSNKPGKSKKEIQEEAARPAPWLGYDRDQVAMHMIARKAFSVAEDELRYAIWLNPFEGRFKRHLGLCLYYEGKYGEAREWVVKALEQEPGDSTARDILMMIDAEIEKTKETLKAKEINGAG